MTPKEQAMSELLDLRSMEFKLATGQVLTECRYGDRQMRKQDVSIDLVRQLIREREQFLGINTENRRRAYGVHFG